MTILSVLDQSPIREGGTAGDAIHETMALARHVEALGYRRYWVAEHHGSPGLAGTAPDILTGQLASVTEHIRVGSGGVMLSHYSPYKVAENFRLLETLYPGRIDLGIGRAPGGDRKATAALQAGPGALGPEYFAHQVADLIAYLANDLDGDHPLSGLLTNPAGPGMPDIWLLGSSDQSAAVAAHFGRAFSFAHFIVGEGGPRVMDAYRRSFRPSDTLAAPQTSIGVHVVCADTEAEAERLAKSRDLWWQRLESGRPTPVPRVETALAEDYSDTQLRRIAAHRRRQVIGAPEQVRDKLLALGRDYGVDEFVVLTVVHDFAARKRSYELLAAAMGVARRRD